MLAIVSTALAELLGGAIALKMLFNMPLKIGAILMAIVVIIMIFSRSYKYIEAWIIGFVSLIGVSFLFELTQGNIPWPTVLLDTFLPSIPVGAIAIIMSVLGAVVMPHNLFFTFRSYSNTLMGCGKSHIIEEATSLCKNRYGFIYGRWLGN